MGGSEPPFLYDPPSRNSQITYPYSDFNPRAATEAHYAVLAERAERQKRKTQQAGKPLINFNQHPDSYMVVNNPSIKFEPLSPNVKRQIIWSRWVQFVFRCVQEVGAVGMLVCVICLKMNNDALGWIIRIAPAWDTVITMYAIYHLLRPAKGRTPTNSASYHFFALFMDTGLIPFYVFIALYSNQNWNEEPDVNGRWTSVFSTDVATTDLIFATWIASMVIGALHAISVGLDLFLIIMFRKIARLPPDMNPLEDNLTGSSRRTRSQKHSYKNSDATFSSVSSDVHEKNKGYLSGSTLDFNPITEEYNTRAIPFGHSRVNSSNDYSPHNPESARYSRQQYDQISLQRGPQSARSSRQDVGSGHRSRAGTVVNPGENTSTIDFGDIPALPPTSNREYWGDEKNRSLVSARGSPDRVEGASTHSAIQSQQKQGLLNDNWYVLDQDVMSDLGTPRRDEKQTPSHDMVPTLPKVELDRHDSFEPQPLKMNPPTPPITDDDYARAHEHYISHDDQQGDSNEDATGMPSASGVSRTLTINSSQTASSSVYSESAPSLRFDGRPNNGTPRGKYYGDLASATRGVRGAVPLSQANFPTVGQAMHARPSPERTRGHNLPTPQQSRTPSPQKGRVISRTGVDIADAAPYTLRGRREISGKVAEEGRGGAWR